MFSNLYQISYGQGNTPPSQATKKVLSPWPIFLSNTISPLAAAGDQKISQIDDKYIYKGGQKKFFTSHSPLRDTRRAQKPLSFKCQKIEVPPECRPFAHVCPK